MKGSTLKGKTRAERPIAAWTSSRVCDFGRMVQRSRGLRSLTHGALPRDVIENVSKDVGELLATLPISYTVRKRSGSRTRTIWRLAGNMKLVRKTRTSGHRSQAMPIVYEATVRTGFCGRDAIGNDRSILDAKSLASPDGIRLQKVLDKIAPWATSAAACVSGISESKLVLAAATLNYMHPGSERPAHIDPGTASVVVSVSLRGNCQVRFLRHLHRSSLDEPPVEIGLHTGSVMSFSGVVRNEWWHQICRVTRPRVAAVYRYVLGS